jgi:hypothetical protein
MLFGPVRLVVRLVSLVVTGAIVYVIVCGVQVVEASRLSTAPSAVHPASAIVVLGQSVVRADQADLTSRLRQAALLYRHDRSRRVIVTWSPPRAGSVGSFAYEEKFLDHYGVPRLALTSVAAPDASTALSKTAKLLGKGTSVIVVTDAIDALWTQGAGAGDGLSVAVSPPPSSKKLVFTELGPFVRETTGVAVGRIFGFGRISWAAH